MDDGGMTDEEFFEFCDIAYAHGKAIAESGNSRDARRAWVKFQVEKATTFDLKHYAREEFRLGYKDWEKE